MIDVDKQLPYLVAITQINGVGAILARQLIAYCGSPEAVFHAKKQSLLKIPGVGPLTVKNVIKEKEKLLSLAYEQIDYLHKSGFKLVHIYSPDYPPRLKNLDDAPPVLYFSGSISLDFKRAVAIVGTRKATEYGKSMAEQLVYGLQGLDVVVISGLAYGIDIMAHRAALQAGIPTLGVMATGLDIIYPSSHRHTAAQMLKNGGLLTEYPPGTRPDAPRFPARNRIIAALADAIVVVESAERGGGLVTAQMGLDYGKEVFAVPGRVGDKYSEGCNQLIASGLAHMVTHSDTLETVMNWQKDEGKTAPGDFLQEINFAQLEPDEATVMQLMPIDGAIPIDELSRRSQISINKMAGILLNLEFQGLVKSLPGSKYTRIVKGKKI